MRVLDGEQILVRIFIGESDRWRGHSLADALIERLRREGFAGATAFRGVSGFGAHSVLHTTSLLRLSEDLPVLIEIVDSDEKVQQLLSVLDEMVPEGLVTMEKVRVVKYASGRKPAASGADAK